MPDHITLSEGDAAIIAVALEHYGDTVREDCASGHLSERFVTSMTRNADRADMLADMIRESERIELVQS